MALDKVFYIPLAGAQNESRTLFSIECVLTHKIYHLLDIFTNNSLVGLKINDHDDEINEVIPAQYFKKMAQILKQKGANPIICATSTRFKDRDENASKHLSLLAKQGFTYSATETPLMMLDGANGQAEIILGDGLPVAGELENLDSLIVVSNCSSNRLMNFKGALYNLGHGTASSRGKRKLMSMSPPQINSQKCYYCRKCLHECPTSAIYIKSRHVEIDQDLCIDCGKCVDIARYGGITYNWDSTPEYFQKRVSLHVDAILEKYKNRILFINFIKNANSQDFSGLLISKNPYQIDLESAKLLNQNPASVITDKEYQLEVINY